MKTICPFCDAENIEAIEISEHYPVPFCDDAVISHQILRCNCCEAEGDFTGSGDRIHIKQIAESNLASAPALLEELAAKGITMTYFEKALRLPFRTTARWKRGKISHSALALLRLIRFSPNLLLVADENFSETAQDQYHVLQPFMFMDKFTTNPELKLTETTDNIGISFSGSPNQKTIAGTGAIKLYWEPSP
jgi:hypothetical protein